MPMDRVDTWVVRHATLIDVLTGVAAFLLLGLQSVTMGWLSFVVDGASAFTGYLATFGMPLAIAFRRRFPVQSAVAINALALLHWVAGVDLLPVDLLIYASVYSTAVHGPKWARRVGLASALFGSFLVSVRYVNEGIELVSATLVLVSLSTPALVAYALGLLRRSTKARREAMRERARQAEHERAQQAVISASGERARIAREMHDVVAHSLSVIVAQADGGRYAAKTDPDAAAQVLETIATTARGALADTRRLLGVLRQDQTMETAPAPGADQIGELVASVRDSGLDVTLEWQGIPQPLSQVADLAVFRVVQEALTNVLKHAGPVTGVRAWVRITWREHELVIQVDDDGRGAAAASDRAGHGLLGMRERMSMFSGTVSAGPRPGGGYRVVARVPLPQEAQG